ncbi:hypothetical protein E2562_009708 [Oryza meyeriana var. granulata]|uniref:Uncharacterized protein n=1 Tax=Oryza meyeriana var. granulata TaxID=110450 RepID=A0A6G1D1Z8_9ORYZ|nr:hypothetical protein E2562_009708 [Oryza meyeriana var. granulata]
MEIWPRFATLPVNNGIRASHHVVVGSKDDAGEPALRRPPTTDHYCMWIFLALQSANATRRRTGQRMKNVV